MTRDRHMSHAERQKELFGGNDCARCGTGVSGLCDGCEDELKADGDGA